MSNWIGKIIARLPGIITKNFLRKLIAVFFAVFVYFMVYQKIGEEDEIYGVPVKLDVPSSLVVLDDSIQRVSVRVRASKKRLKSLVAGDLQVNAVLDERKFVPETGRYVLRIDSTDINPPAGVKVLKVVPEKITIRLDRKVEARVKVKARFLRGSKPAEGYTVSDVKLNPAEVILTGPAFMLEGKSSVQSAPIPLDSSSIENFDIVRQVDTNSDLISSSPPKVLVNVEIVKNYETMTFRSVPIKILSSSRNEDMDAELLSTPHVDVTVTGVKSTIEMLNARKIRAYIDISSFEEPGIYNVDVGCWFGEDDVKLVSIYPAKVQVKLTAESPEKPSVKSKESENKDK